MNASTLFLYTSCEYQIYEAEAGSYLLEVWGAQGGYNGYGGKGGYSRGVLSLSSHSTLYVRVGGSGEYQVGGCNGGGVGDSSSGGGGGGGTDIRIGIDSLFSRVIVAGGGGGSTQSSTEPGGYGGGLIGGRGENGYSRAGIGGSQTSGGITCGDGSTTGCPPGSFGQGGTSGSASAGSGGGGWYGGSGSSSDESGGGGSGYVFTSSSFKPPGFTLESIYYLTNTSIFDGSQTFTKPDGSGSEIGHTGDGSAKITILSILNPTPLKSLSPSLYLAPTMTLCLPENCPTFQSTSLFSNNFLLFFIILILPIIDFQIISLTSHYSLITL